MNALTNALGKVTETVSNLIPGKKNNKNVTVVAEGAPNGNVAVMANLETPVTVGGRRRRRNTMRKNNTRRRRNNTRRNNMRRRRNTRRNNY